MYNDLIAKLRESAVDIEVNGTPAQAGLDPATIREVADALEALSRPIAGDTVSAVMDAIEAEERQSASRGLVFSYGAVERGVRSALNSFQLGKADVK
jgi:hypothetical protein